MERTNAMAIYWAAMEFAMGVPKTLPRVAQPVLPKVRTPM
jgi:hypothetical protein